MANDLYRLWFRKLSLLSPGEKMFLPCDTKPLAKEILKVFEQERKFLAETNAPLANRIDFSIHFQQGRHMVTGHVCENSPDLGFIRSKGDRQPRPVRLSADHHRIALLSSLLTTHTLEEIESLSGPISDDERLYFGLLQDNKEGNSE